MHRQDYCCVAASASATALMRQAVSVLQRQAYAGFVPSTSMTGLGDQASPIFSHKYQWSPFPSNDLRFYTESAAIQGKRNGCATRFGDGRTFRALDAKLSVVFLRIARRSPHAVHAFKSEKALVLCCYARVPRWIPTKSWIVPSTILESFRPLSLWP